MKKTIQVTVIKTIEVEIDDSLLTKESLENFSEYMWPISEPIELFEYAASHIARFDEAFVEGVDNPRSPEWNKRMPEKQTRLVYRDINEDVECEEIF